MINFTRVVIDPTKVSSRTIQARPASKSNVVWETVINGEKYFCERPNYKNSEFDLSIMIPTLSGEGEILYGQKLEWVADQNNRYWVPAKLSSFFLTEYFISHPLEYLRLSGKRRADIQSLVNKMKVVHENQSATQAGVLAEHWQIIRGCWNLIYRTGNTFIFAADEIVWQWREMLLQFLPKKQANEYLAQFLRAPITEEAIKRGVVNEKIGTRNILYSNVEPLLFYVAPELFVSSPQDHEILVALESSTLSSDQKQRFYALRLMVPLTIQHNEENQYIESKTMSAHTVKILQKISNLLVARGVMQNFEDIKNLAYEEILGHLQKTEPLKVSPSSLRLQGIGSSAGVAVGKVKVVKTFVNNEEFSSGDILVTEITDPSMVALMARAGAIVCDIGSITSHPSIVSRELGIPCVVATKNGTTVLQDGMTVRVNGTTGEVVVIDVGPYPPAPPDTEIDRFLDDIVPAACQMDFSTFGTSISWDKYDPTIADGWCRRLLELVERCEQENITPLSVARLFPNMSELRGTMYFDLYTTKYSSLTLTERLKIFSFFSSALNARCLEDSYAKNKNIIHTAEEIKKLTSDVQTVSTEEKRLLGRLINACYHVGYAFYSDMHPTIAYENYGPYDVSSQFGPGSVAIVKEFGNLQGQGLWDRFVNVPCNQIQIICIYQNTNIRIDGVSHIIYEGEANKNMVSAVVKVDGEIMADLHGGSSLCEALELAATTAYQHFLSLGVEEKKKLYYQQKAYTYKRFYEQWSEPWPVGEEIVKEGVGKPLAFMNWPKDQEARENLLRRMLDPRINPASIPEIQE